ncbi:YcnI family copper-binding membrane protein [Micromonosporaceae bacterium Da 78-11]
MRTRLTRIVAAAASGVVLATVVIPAGPAAAHVSVSPTQAAQGGFAVLTFRVPNEREGRSTSKVQVFFPTGTPIIGATMRQLTGWTSKVVQGPLSTPVTVDGTAITRAVTSITWSAKDAANAIGGSDYQEFGVSVGPLPRVERVTFKALQTYDDGQVARWIEEPVDGAAEPQSPAVVLRLSAGGGEQLDAHGNPLPDGAAPASAVSAPIVQPAGSSPVTLVIAIAALVIAVAALLAVVLRRPRPSRNQDVAN